MLTNKTWATVFFTISILLVCIALFILKDAVTSYNEENYNSYNSNIIAFDIILVITFFISLTALINFIIYRKNVNKIYAMDYDEILNLAQTSKEEKVLQILAQYENINVKLAVAKNKNITPAVNRILINDYNSSVIMAANKNNAYLANALEDKEHMASFYSLPDASSGLSSRISNQLNKPQDSTVKSFFNNGFNFDGVASVKGFWLSTFFVAGVWIGLIILSATIATAFPALAVFIYVPFIWLLICFIPLISIQVRRYHDSGHSGAWFFVPIANFFLLFYPSVEKTIHNEDKEHPQNYTYTISELIQMAQSDNHKIRAIALKQPNLPKEWREILLDDSELEKPEANSSEALTIQAEDKNLYGFQLLIEDKDGINISQTNLLTDKEKKGFKALVYSNGILFYNYKNENTYVLFFEDVTTEYYKWGLLFLKDSNFKYCFLGNTYSDKIHKIVSNFK